MKVFILIVAIFLATCFNNLALGARIPKLFRLNKSINRFGVIGGKDAKPGEAPYQVEVLLEGSLTCGGSIISPRTIITAANCVHDFKGKPDVISIRYGTNKRSSSPYPDSNISHIIVHEHYVNKVPWPNNIALIILKTPINFNSKVDAIEIETEDLPDGSLLYLYGWGRASMTTHFVPENLQRGDLHLIRNKKCQEMWNKPVLTDAYICTLDKTQSACVGDAGGPLVSSKKRLAGIVSWARGDCKPGTLPVVFTHSSYYKEWIEKNMVY